MRPGIGMVWIDVVGLELTTHARPKALCRSLLHIADPPGKCWKLLKENLSTARNRGGMAHRGFRARDSGSVLRYGNSNMTGRDFIVFPWNNISLHTYIRSFHIVVFVTCRDKLEQCCCTAPYRLCGNTPEHRTRLLYATMVGNIRDYF